MCDKTRLVHSKKVSFFDLGGRSLFLEKLCDANLCVIITQRHRAVKCSETFGHPQELILRQILYYPCLPQVNFEEERRDISSDTKHSAFIFRLRHQIVRAVDSSVWRVQ